MWKKTSKFGPRKTKSCSVDEKTWRGLNASEAKNVGKSLKKRGENLPHPPTHKNVKRRRKTSPKTSETWIKVTKVSTFGEKSLNFDLENQKVARSTGRQHTG